MRFSFIHAADLHIDSPLSGLSLKDAAVAERFAKAGRTAVEALVAEAITSEVAFVIIAGDVFDGDWKDVTTGLFFVRIMGALHRASIPAFIVKGNHDAVSVMSRDLPYPETVKLFPSNKAESFFLDDLRVALHGRSFPNRHIGEFVQTYPPRRDGWLNIGVLHTSLDGRRGHEGYAPCTVDDLKRFGYDYWALGHVHAAEIVNRDPWIVYPGNLQGRSIRETGAKGAMRVTVENGRIIDVVPVALDGARWVRLSIDLAEVDNEADAIAKVVAELDRTHVENQGRPLAARITLTGLTPLHNLLIARQELIRDDIRAIGLRIAEDCWIEQIKIQTSAPARQLSSAENLDIEDLLAETTEDPELTSTLSQLVTALKEKLPRDLQEKFSDPDLLKVLVSDARALLAGECSEN